MNSRSFTAVIATPVGRLGLVLDAQYIVGLSWLSRQHALVPAPTRHARAICTALSDYFDCADNFPRLPLKLSGSDFQLKVWAAMQEIPTGSTVSYGGLAAILNTSSRAVGQACRSNPVAVLVPCHRVVSARGIGGYMGKAKQLNIKQWLLEHEGASVC
ncbi:MAG: methylated-DNA--[protein]-cysteine S-methyltransferase [Gammaproteobacteria bacterium]